MVMKGLSQLFHVLTDVQNHRFRIHITKYFQLLWMQLEILTFDNTMQCKCSNGNGAPEVQNFLNFMQFFWNFWQNHRLAPSPWRVGAPSTENPGSAPEIETIIPRKTVSVFPFSSETFFCLLGVYTFETILLWAWPNYLLEWQKKIINQWNKQQKMKWRHNIIIRIRWQSVASSG